MRGILLAAISIFALAFLFGCGGDTSSISGFPRSYPGGYGGPYYRGSSGSPSDMVEDEVLLKFKEGTQKPDIDAFLSANGAKADRKIDGIDVYVVKIPKGTSPLQFVEKVREDPRLEFAEPNFIVRIAGNEEGEVPVSRAVPEVGFAPGDIGLSKAWEVTKGIPKVLVAIVDTGADPDHEALRDGLLPGKDMLDEKGRAKDENGHGTFLAGIILARGSEKVSGIAPNCKGIPVKVLDRLGTGSVATLAEGIVWAVGAGARVILVGSGTYKRSRTLGKAVDYASDMGSIVVAPAGNDKKEDPFYPAAYERCIAVAAVDKMDKKAAFSNYGRWVDICAPGYARSTMTSYKSYMTSEGKKPKGYAEMEGTSVAAAYVAGALALMISAAPDEKAIRDKLELSSDPVDGLNPKELEGKLGKGRVNVGRALALLLPGSEKARDEKGEGR
jgi:thermitase